MLLPSKEAAGGKSQQVALNALKLLAAGGIAGAVSRTATAPLDRLKIILQTQGKSKEFTGVAQGLARLYKLEGVHGFWRGNGVNVSKIVPEAGIRFMSFEMYKTWFLGDQPGASLTTTQRLLAGGLAGVTSQITIYPLEVIRSRLAVSGPSVYRGVIDCFQKTVQQDGFKAFYRGINPSLLGIFPFAAIDLGVYDLLKKRYSTNHKNKEPTIPVLLACGAISSTCGQLVSYPLDLVRRRLQIQGMPGQPVYKGMVDAFSQIVKNEGWKGLYGGMIPNVLKVIPAVSISYVTYETMKKQFQVR